MSAPDVLLGSRDTCSRPPAQGHHNDTHSIHFRIRSGRAGFCGKLSAPRRKHNRIFQL